MHVPDNFEKLLLTIDGYNAKFPRGNTPFQIITRLCEETGELASEVNHFENTGVKRQKHGEPDRVALAKEAHDVILTALSVVRYYGIEKELQNLIEQRYQAKIDEGYLP